MDEVRTENERLCAMFMMEGLHSAGYDMPFSYLYSCALTALAYWTVSSCIVTGLALPLFRITHDDQPKLSNR